MSTGIGARVPRKEDARHLAGKAQFVGDLSFPRLWEVAFVRSPLAHARIRSDHRPRTARGPRVHRRTTWKACARSGPNPACPAYKSSDYPPLARGKVRFAGECVALCIAPTRAEAEDIAEAVELDLEALPAVTDSLAARRPGRPPRTRRVGRQPVPHHLGRRRLRSRCSEARRRGHRTRVPHRASMHGADGGQGGTRHARRTQGPARRVHLHPGAAPHPHRALPVSRARPGGRAGHRARRGRRVRLQVRAAARGGLGVMGGDAHRPAVALGRGPARAPHRGRQHPPAPLPG